MADKMGITDTGRAEVPHWHFPRFSRRDLMIVMFAVALLAGITLLALSQTIWKNASLLVPPAQAPPSQGIVVPAPTLTPTPEKVLGQTGMGAIIVRLNNEKIGIYSLLTWFTPPGTPGYYDFPLVLEGPPGGRIVATITDPNIEESGGEWSSGLIRDPEPGYENFAFNIKLTRVINRTYKYKVEFLSSPDGGKH